MKTKYINLVVSAAVLLAGALACNLPFAATQTSVPTPVSTSGAGAPTSASVAPNGIAVSFSGTSFSIPDELGDSATPENVASMDNEPVPSWEIAPAFVQFTLVNYPVQGSLLKPMIYVYPAAKYAGDNTGAAESIRRLRALISGPGKDFKLQTVPFVPAFNATQTFIARAMPLKFKNGAGIRMLTQYDQAPIPANNHELIYHFEGLTNDGAYYVIAVLPVNAITLPADGNPASAVPAGGIPFNQDDPAAYFQAVSQNLNDAAPDSLTPKLNLLDALVQSIKISAP